MLYSGLRQGEKAILGLGGGALERALGWTWARCPSFCVPAPCALPLLTPPCILSGTAGQVGMYTYHDLGGEDVLCSVECKLALLHLQCAPWLGGTESACLPDGWEQRTAADGRIFYLDHNTCTSHWSVPV